MIAFLAFIHFLEKSQRNYIDKFKNQTIEMDDFALRIKNLPVDASFRNNPEALKCHLIQHFEKVIKDQMRKENGGHFGQDEDFEYQPELDKEGKVWQIIDIDFGRSDTTKDLTYLDELSKLRSEYMSLNIKNKMTSKDSEQN